MPELHFTVMPGKALKPSTNQDIELMAKWKIGDVVAGSFKKPRNAQFHRKFFALLDLAYDAWEPPEGELHGMPVQKNRERFRKDLIIAAGYFEPVSNIKGDTRAEALSMSFAAMDEAEFGEFYLAVQNVILQYVLKNYTKEDLDSVVDQIMGFL